MDTTMCKGDGCPLKDNCLRFTAKPNEYRQAYFITPPYKKDEGCEYKIVVVNKDKNKSEELPHS